MTKPKITYRGWPGHYICAHLCQFRLNTLIEYGKDKIVVSTVGLLTIKDRFEEIGSNRYFETIVFHAHKVREFWDADISKPVSFKSQGYWSKISDELNAQKGHEKIVKEIVSNLKKGKLL
jgi:hypothetical protein